MAESLTINPGTAGAVDVQNGDYGLVEFECPAPPEKILWAGSIDTEGSLPVAPGHENRELRLTVECGSAAAFAALQAAVALVHREGGELEWELADGRSFTFDLRATSGYTPRFDVSYFVSSGEFCSVDFAFVAAPYARGEEISGTVHTGSTGHCVFVESDIGGDVDALGRLEITNSTTDRTFMTWGLRSRYYSADPAAALLIQAEGVLAYGGVDHAGYTGASGSGADRAKRFDPVGTTGVATYLEVGSQKHAGDFRAFARLQADSSNTGTVSVQASWITDPFAGFTNGGWVPVVNSAGSPIEGSWVLADLGLITIPVARTAQDWTLFVRLRSTVATDAADLDYVLLVPAEESGMARTAPRLIQATDTIVVAHDGVEVIVPATLRGRPREYRGDYLLVPPSGADGRSVEFVAVLAGASGGNLTETIVDAQGVNAITATLHHTPRWLVLPAPGVGP